MRSSRCQLSPFLIQRSTSPPRLFLSRRPQSRGKQWAIRCALITARRELRARQLKSVPVDPISSFLFSFFSCFRFGLRLSPFRFYWHSWLPVHLLISFFAILATSRLLSFVCPPRSVVFWRSGCLIARDHDAVPLVKNQKTTEFRGLVDCQSSFRFSFGRLGLSKIVLKTIVFASAVTLLFNLMGWSREESTTTRTRKIILPVFFSLVRLLAFLWAPRDGWTLLLDTPHQLFLIFNFFVRPLVFLSLSQWADWFIFTIFCLDVNTRGNFPRCPRRLVWPTVLVCVCVCVGRSSMTFICFSSEGLACFITFKGARGRASRGRHRLWLGRRRQVVNNDR